MADGGAVPTSRTPASQAPANPTLCLEVRGLTKRFGALAASDDLSFQVQDGHIHALIGPNGAGKTTAMAQIFGEVKPDAGQVLFGGVDITHWPTPKRAQAALQRSYQITSVFPELTVLDNVALAVQAKSGRSYRFWSNARQDTDLREPAMAALDRVGLGATDLASRSVTELSHGQKRQLELAMVLATQPRLMLLDEPMAGLGPAETQQMSAILADLRGGVTILLVEHDMDVVFGIADLVTVLVKGRALATGTPDEIRANADVRAAYLGDAA